MLKHGQLPIPLQMALGAVSGEMIRRNNANSIAELEAQADALNEQARMYELMHNAAAANAFKHTQAQVVLRPGGMHPAFGYEVPVGNDQGMIRTAAIEMGRGMARDEAAFRKRANMRKAALSMGNKLGIGAGLGLAAVGATGIAADKGIRATNKYVLNQPYAGHQMKLGEALVFLHGEGMDKEALGWAKSLGTALKGGWLKGRSAFRASTAAGSGRLGAARHAISQGGAQARRTMGAARGFTPGSAAVTNPRSGGVIMGSSAQRVPAKTAPPVKTTPASAPVSTPAEVKPSTQTSSTSAATQSATSAPAPTTSPTGDGWGDKVKQWGQKWVVNPAKFTARNPWTLAVGGGVAAAGYGGVRAAKAGIDTMQQHNPQYTYNQGGYQVPTSVGQYGYTKAPGIRY